MIDDQNIRNLSQVFKRIFSMPISRLTFRELQSAVLTAAGGDKEQARLFLESILSGSQPGAAPTNVAHTPALDQLIQEHGVSVWVAKDVFEKADFINFISSDIHTQPNRAFFSHALRKVDGEEFTF